MQSSPRVTLVGAGPGGLDLMTVKGLRAIQSADIILYDALVDRKILEEVGENCVNIFVGKRSGCHYKSQSEINDLIVSSALEYGHCVRLKGGDPFVFGRGHEELEYVRKHNITVEVIPGVSSATALPVLQEVPLTKRNISESFWVLTATTKEHKLSKDIELAAQSSATLVILMGMKKINKIASLLADMGRENLPMMIVQNGSHPDEVVTIGSVKDFLHNIKIDESLPGTIFVGGVVKLHPLFEGKAITSKQQFYYA